jgi:hypothetical protein
MITYLFALGLVLILVELGVTDCNRNRPSVDAFSFLHLDFRTSFSAEFQGGARLLSASKWRCNKCTFCTHTESRP